MGLIRKTLMVGTVGVVRGSSKKQRVAKAHLKQAKEQTAIARQQLAMDQQQSLSATTAPAPAAPAAGWFPDQTVPGQLRYFDGQQWTNQTAHTST